MAKNSLTPAGRMAAAEPSEKDSSPGKMVEEGRWRTRAAAGSKIVGLQKIIAKDWAVNHTVQEVPGEVGSSRRNTGPEGEVQATLCPSGNARHLPLSREALTKH